MNVQKVFRNILVEIASINSLNEKADIHASELDALCDQLNELSHTIDDLLAVRATKLVQLGSFSTSMLEYVQSMRGIYEKCTYKPTGTPARFLCHRAEPFSTEIKSRSLRVDEYLEQLRVEVNIISKPSPFERKDITLGKGEMISMCSHTGFVGDTPALVRKLLNWDPDEAEKLAELSKGNARFLPFLAFSVVPTGYLIAFALPMCSLRMTLCALPSGLPLAAILTALYQIADVCRFLHSNGYKLNLIALDSVYLVEQLEISKEGCKISVCFNDCILSSTTDTRSDWDETLTDRCRWLAPEALREHKFTPATDVWAFGVFCWEVFSSGAIPWGGKFSIPK